MTCAALFCSGLSSPAQADERPEVVIAVDALRDPVAVRLRAELRVLGFAVVVVQARARAPSRALLESAVHERGAVAAFRITRSHAGVEVWIFDRFTSKTVLREVIVGGEPDALAHAALVATRAVELLRASLLELSLPPRGVYDPETPKFS